MTAEVLAFLGGDPRKLAIFEAYEAAVLACGESTRKVTKTQISWGNPYLFAMLSHPRRAADRKAGALLATFGLNRRLDSPRILQAVEPYPGRWTHHLLLSGRRRRTASCGPGWRRPTNSHRQNSGGDRTNVCNRAPSVLYSR